MRDRCLADRATVEWDDYFSGIATAVEKKSKDARSPVGAVIVGEDRVLLSTGFNGLARFVLDLEERLDPTTKLPWMCHAEMNAILNAARIGVSLMRSTIYVTKFPCDNCANAIVQAGIRRVFTLDDHYWTRNPNGDDGTRAEQIFREAGIMVHSPRLKPRRVEESNGSSDEEQRSTG